MKIIPFPKQNKSNKTQQEDIDNPTGISKAELIDIQKLLKNSTSTAKSSPPSITSDFTSPSAGSSESNSNLFERILRTAKEICASEAEVAAAVCTMIDELVKKTAPLKRKFFIPSPKFIKMIGNEFFEDEFSVLIQSFPGLHKYHDISLGQLLAMFDKDWPFTTTERTMIDFCLHIIGAHEKIDLLALKAYLAERDWEAVCQILEKHEF